MLIDKKGFSLLEVLASVLLLAGLISIVVQLSYGNTRRMRKSQQLEKIASLLELKMRELEEEFKGARIVDLPEQDQGDFENEENYSWSYETQALTWPPADLFLSLTQLPASEINIKMAQTLNSVLSNSVVELKLTVQQKTKRGKGVSYSLVSYFINYEDAPSFIFSNIADILPAGANL